MLSRGRNGQASDRPKLYKVYNVLVQKYMDTAMRYSFNNKQLLMNALDTEQEAFARQSFLGHQLY